MFCAFLGTCIMFPCCFTVHNGEIWILMFEYLECLLFGLVFYWFFVYWFNAKDPLECNCIVWWLLGWKHDCFLAHSPFIYLFPAKIGFIEVSTWHVTHTEQVWHSLFTYFIMQWIYVTGCCYTVIHIIITPNFLQCNGFTIAISIYHLLLITAT